MYKVIGTITIIIGALIFGIVAHISLKKQEQKECVQWSQYAKEYPKFYYTQWQKEQCHLK